VIAHALVLRWVGLWWGAQAVGLGLLALWGLAGFRVLHARTAAFPDRFGVAATSVALGFAVHLGLAFVFFHRPLVKALGVADLRAAALLALGVLVVPAVGGARRLRGDLEPRRWLVSPVGALVLFAGASLVALLAAYGYRDGLAGPENQVSALVAAGQSWRGRDVVPEWGSTQDRHQQLFEGGVALRGFPKGFPRGRFEHRGVETALTAVGYLVGPFQEESWMAVAKPLSLLWLFLAAYGLYAIARPQAPEGAAVAAGLGALLYAALNPSLLTGAAASSYRVFPASGTLYHSVTQQASLGLGFIGIALCVRALQDGARLYAPGCALLLAALFCKPSFFLIAGPLVLLAALLHRRVLERADAVAGAAWLLGGVAFWLLYPRVLGLPTLGLPVEPGFFAWQRNTDLHLPWDVARTGVLVVSVLTLSFAAFVLPLADLLRRRPRPSPSTLLLAAIALLGVGCGLLLVEQGRKAGQGNVMWSAAAGLLLALPLLVRAIGAIESRAARIAAWSIYAAHLASGAWNLWWLGFRGLF